MMQRWVITAAIVLGAGAVGRAQPAGSGAGAPGKVLQLPLDATAPTVRAAASPTIVPLGGHFTLYITATFAPGVVVNLREPIGLGAAFEIRRQISEDRQTSDGRTTREWQLDVMPWEVGDRQVPPLAVTFTFAGQAAQVQTNAVPLKIVGALGDIVDDPRAMRGLAPPTALSARDWLWIWIAAAAAAVVIVVVVALWWHGRRRRRVVLPTAYTGVRAPPTDMTADRALAQLQALERAGALGRDGERKAAYTQMVEIVRAYLGARFRIAVLDLTSAELIARLTAAAPDDADRIAAWLAGCDLVKYGASRATTDEAAQALADARGVIAHTSQRRRTREAA
jgi:hypothetical protein